MKKLDDMMLEQSARQIIDQLDACSAIDRQDENSNVTHIKLAKAKAGARRHINRTIRVCAVAAVMMIGLVFAVFMGAKDDEYRIQIDKTGFMWENSDPESKYNNQVRIYIDLKGVGEDASYKYFEGEVSIKDMNGKTLLKVTDQGFLNKKLSVFRASKYPDGVYYFSLENVLLSRLSPQLLPKKYGTSEDYLYREHRHGGYYYYFYPISEECDFYSMTLRIDTRTSDVEISLLDREAKELSLTDAGELKENQKLANMMVFVMSDAETREEAVDIRKRNNEKYAELRFSGVEWN
ncbi:MAG: hypothetical protein IJF14_01120 [Clostridia bacterium]|nr:hypothetical protein [Clostridia bacterium]